VGRRKRPAEFGPYARWYCSTLDQPWPDGCEDKLVATWARTLAKMKRNRVDLSDGWLYLDARGIRSVTCCKRVDAGLRVLEELSRVVNLQVEVTRSTSCRLLSEDFLVIQGEINGRLTKQEGRDHRHKIDPVIGPLRARNLLRNMDPSSTNVDVPLGEGEVEALQGKEGMGGEGVERGGAAPDVPSVSSTHEDVLRLRMDGARFAALLDAEERRLGLQPGVMGPTTLVRVGRWMRDDWARLEVRAVNAVRSRLNKPGAVSCDWIFMGDEERARCRWEGLVNGPVWGQDGAVGHDREPGGGPGREETIEAERARVAVERARPVATPEEIRVVTESLARKLGWPQRGSRPTRDLSGERERQKAELVEADRARRLEPQ